jgi:hypothetical protein
MRLQGAFEQMPDFEVNEGYVEAGRRRADSPLPALRADERVSADGRSATPDGDGATSGRALGEAAEESTVGAESSRRLPEERPIVRRTRHHAGGHFSASGASPRRRVGVELMARRRRLARRACPYGWQVRVLGTPPRRRRHLWTMCHSKAPLS